MRLLFLIGTVLTVAACSQAPKVANAPVEQRQPASLDVAVRMENRSFAEVLQALMATHSREDRELAIWNGLVSLRGKQKLLVQMKSSEALSDATRSSIDNDIGAIQEQIREMSRGIHIGSPYQVILTDAQIAEIFRTLPPFCDKTRFSFKDQKLTLKTGKKDASLSSSLKDQDGNLNVYLAGDQIIANLRTGEMCENGKILSWGKIIWDAKTGSLIDADIELTLCKDRVSNPHSFMGFIEQSQIDWNFNRRREEKSAHYECLAPPR